MKSKRLLTHGAEGLATVKGVDHANLGVRSAASDDEGKERKSIDLIIRELVESARKKVSCDSK